MCYLWTHQRQQNELSIDEWKKVIFEIKKFSGLHVPINIMGGEPMLKKNILDLISFTVNKGFAEVSMTTNGSLITKNVAEQIAASGLQILNISLDSIDEKTYEFIRGRKNSFKKVMNAIHHVQKYRDKIRYFSIQTLIMEQNMNGIMELIQWSKKKILLFGSVL